MTESGPGTHSSGLPPTAFRPALVRPVLALGRSAVVTAVLVVLFVLASVSGVGWLRALVLVPGAVAVLVTLALGLRVLVRLAGRGPRLVLDPDGYTNTTGRAPRRVRWSEVRRLAAVTAGGRLLLVADLADGRTSVVLLRRLGAASSVVEQAMRDRLNAANGYSPLT